MRAIVFDVETWIDWRFIRETGQIEEIEDRYEPPSSYRDPVKIAAHQTRWFKAERDKWTFSPLTAKVCSIAWADLWEGPVHVVTSTDETFVLETFAAAMRGDSPSETTEIAQIGETTFFGPNDGLVLTGFNVRRFDVPFVTARASIHGIRLPWWWPHAKDYRRIADLCDVTGSGSLDKWLKRCELPAKTGSGGMVETMPVDEIRDYNANDVHVERLLARRFASNMAALRRADEEPVDYSEVPAL